MEDPNLIRSLKIPSSAPTLLPCCQQSWLCLADRFPLALRVPRKTQAMLWILPFRDARIGSQLSESDPWATDFLDISWHFLTFHVSVLSVLGQCMSVLSDLSSDLSLHVAILVLPCQVVLECRLEPDEPACSRPNRQPQHPLDALHVGNGTGMCPGVDCIETQDECGRTARDLSFGSFCWST